MGTYGGVPKDAIALALLPDDFEEPNPYNSTGFLGNATTPLTSFYALYAEVDQSGGVNDICFSKLRFLYPRLIQLPSKSSLDSTYYSNWTQNSLGGM